MSSSILRAFDFCGLATLAEFHAPSLGPEGCNDSDSGSHDGCSASNDQGSIIVQQARPAVGCKVAQNGGDIVIALR
jgi:hypothetical protein